MVVGQPRLYHLLPAFDYGRELFANSSVERQEFLAMYLRVLDSIQHTAREHVTEAACLPPIDPCTEIV